MKLLNYSFILMILVSASSCKKQEYPQSQTLNEAPFYFNATISGAPVSITAGVDDYYMYSSFAQDANNLYCFKAELKKIDCDNCINSLQIKINDFQTSAVNGPVQINQAISPGNFPIIAGPAYSATFQSVYNKTASGYFWDFGDGTTSNSANPVHIFAKKGKYNVSLKIKGTDSCYSSVSNIVNMGYPGSTIAMISHSYVSPDVVQFSSNAQGTGALNYFWSFGDGTASTLANPSHTYAITGAYPVVLRVISATDTIYAKYNTVTQGDLSSCTTNYSVTAPQTSSLSFSGITVNWTDAFGNVYSSDNIAQPSSSYFQVLSVEDYEPNEKGELTKKIRLKFKCNVYNGVNTRVIDNAEATICVSYK